MLSVGPINNYRATNFRASATTSPDEASIRKLMTDQKKAQKKENRKRNIAIGAQVMLALAFVTIAATTVYQMVKGMGKTPKTVFSQVGNMPKLTDDCVNPKAKDFIERVTRLFNKDSSLKDYVGVKKRANMVLFYGPTGTGKTFSAKLLAKEMGAEYGEVQFSELSSAYIGQTAVNITNKFAELAKLARKNPDKKYVVAFNEIDSLINNIDKLGSNNLHLGQNRTSFLNGLDSIRNIPNLTIVGTTNVNPHSANLDPATLSRLGETFEITAPSVKEIAASLKYHLKDSKAAEDLVKNSTELEKLAKSIHEKGGVQRDVESIVNTALEDFAGKIENTSVKFTPDYINKVIMGKETWAATVGKPQSIEQEVEQFLNKPGVMDYLKNMLGLK